jgi:hypothetical protein
MPKHSLKLFGGLLISLLAHIVAALLSPARRHLQRLQAWAGCGCTFGNGRKVMAIRKAPMPMPQAPI